MQKLAEICIRRPVFAAMIVLSLVVVGAASYFRLGVDRFLSGDLPTVSVRTQLPGASSEEVETLVSQPIEEAVNTVEGIDELRSVSAPGTSIIIATFKLDRDLETAAQDVRDRVTANLGGSAVRLRDVGRVEDSTKEQRSLARLNGVPTVTLQIQRQSGANTIEVIQGIKQAMARVEGQLPSDVKMEVIRDQSRYIEAALHEITVHLVLGSIRASLVVLVFMRSWRSTLIAAVAIPASVVSTFAMMRALDFTLNSVTMLALVLMVGVVIDDAIVVLENIFRFVEEKRMTAMEAAREATADIGLAVLATTLSLVVIFLPVSFMSSISVRFLYQFGITAAVAILVSLLVSFALTPMMSARLLRAEDAGGPRGEGDGEDGFYAMIDRY